MSQRTASTSDTVADVSVPQGVLETCLYADDLEAAQAFYVDVLGLDLYSVDSRHVFFRCGQGMFLVFDPRETATGRVEVNGALIPQHGAHGVGHVAFRMPEAERDAWRRRLIARGVEIESEVDWPNGGHSIYFRDPAGNSVELATPRIWNLSEEATD